MRSILVPTALIRWTAATVSLIGFAVLASSSRAPASRAAGVPAAYLEPPSPAFPVCGATGDGARAGASLGGIVLGPDGRGVPDAAVNVAGGGGAYALFTDEDGRFELTLASAEPCDVIALDPEGRLREATRLRVPAGTTNLVLQLTRAMAMGVRVSTREGAPIERYAVGVIALRDATVLQFQVEAGRPNGLAEVRVPAQDFIVEVRANGWRPARLGPFAFDSTPPALEFQLAPAGSVQGVVEADGEPLRRARVGLYEAAAPGDTFNGYPLRMRPEALLETECGKGARFSLSVERSGTYYLRVGAEGYGTTEIGPLELSAEEPHEERIELGPGGTLEARVRSASGAPVADRLVSFSRGDGLARTLRTDAAGLVRFDALTSGPAEVELSDVEIDPSRGSLENGAALAGPIPTNCRVVAGEVTRVDLWLEHEDERACRLGGRLVIDGEPATGWVVDLGLPGGAVEAQELDAGSFRLGASAPGACRLSLRPVRGDACAQLAISEPLELCEGEQFWSLELETATVAGTLAEPASSGVFHRWRRGALECLTPIVPDEHGRFRARVPAGRGEIVRLDREPIVLQEISLEAGEVLAVQL